MKKKLFSPLMIVVFILEGCMTTKIGANLDAGTIGVEFTFQRENMCFGPSPRIMLTNLPSATRHLKVSLRDLDHPGADHGGGDLKNFSATLIPSGALKAYQGPCPVMTDHRRYHYVFKVEALDETGHVIAFGQAMRECGWVDFK
jgi:phosphatidylethanolamine-binding protein (PEBP) family uncharacterized protein